MLRIKKDSKLNENQLTNNAHNTKVSKKFLNILIYPSLLCIYHVMKGV